MSQRRHLVPGSTERSKRLPPESNDEGDSAATAGSKIPSKQSNPSFARPAPSARGFRDAAGAGVCKQRIIRYKLRCSVMRFQIVSTLDKPSRSSPRRERRENFDTRRKIGSSDCVCGSSAAKSFRRDRAKNAFHKGDFIGLQYVCSKHLINDSGFSFFKRLEYSLHDLETTDPYLKRLELIHFRL